jgi:hypothetical protein
MGSKYTDYSDATIDSLWDKIAAKDKRIAELEEQLLSSRDHTEYQISRREAAEAKVKELEAEKGVVCLDPHGKLELENQIDRLC